MERPEFDRLLTASLPEIRHIVRTYAAHYGQLHEWEDLTQTALLKMLRFAGLYDPGRGALLSWACIIIVNTIKTHLARAAARPYMEELNTLIPAQPGSSPEEYAQMAFVLSYLNEEARMLAEGYNYPEIAARCGFKSRSTAKARIDGCAGRLRKLLGITPEQRRRTRMYAKV